MTRHELTHQLYLLFPGNDPATARRLPSESCLHDTDVIAALRETLRRTAEPEVLATLVTANEIITLTADLRALNYPADAEQVSRVLTGSRSVVDPALRGLPAFARYRGLLTRRELQRALRGTSGATASSNAERPDKPWLQEAFFRSGPFDELSEEKQTELQAEVELLGLRKPTDRLPAYMQRARQRLPRSFEPWTREERALLIEAMCYTNDSDRLAAVFGRSASAVRHEGKRLIWESRSRGAA